MSRRKRRSNPLLIALLVVLIAGAAYVNFVVVPVTPPLFIPTATPTRSPDSYLTDAVQFAQKGKYIQAAQAYEQALQADPRNINTYIALAQLETLYGDYSKALENISNALLLNPNHALAQAVQGWTLGLQGEYQLATAALSSAIEVDPGSGLAYAYYAEVLALMQTEQKGDLTTIDKMSQFSKKAQELAPDAMETHRARGLVLEATGNTAEAISEFERAVSLADYLPDLHLALGRNYRADNQYDKAITEFNRAITLKPDDPLPYLYTARTYLTVGEVAKAIQYANQAIQQKPDDPLLYANLGTMLYRNGSYAEAIVPLRLATRGGLNQDGVAVKGMPMDATSVEFYARYGLALARSGQCGEALQISQAVVQAFPGDDTQQFNAQEMINICKIQAGEVTATPEATPAP